MRLVLCDDNLILSEALTPALTACGHQVVAITTSLAAGMAAVSAHQPDACLLGLRFPDVADSLAAISHAAARPLPGIRISSRQISGRS